MEKFVIKGGKPLRGSVQISGAKNSAVAILPAALLADTPSVIDNLPDIKDIELLAQMIRNLGGKIEKKKHEVVIDPIGLNSFYPPRDLASQMRASYYLIGALLSKFNEAVIAMPGGCNIGVRPIDQHIKGFEALGAKTTIEHGLIRIKADKLVGNHIYFDVVSVGATINLMLASVKAEGVTILENCAKEPHVVDVANFLNAMGANIKGAGTDTIKITGVDKLHGCHYTIIPDQIEAGTYMVAAAATKGDVYIKGIIPNHLEAIIAKLVEMGVIVEEYDDVIRVRREGPLKHVDIRTLPYPGFPTDMQQPFAVLLALADGISVITENIYENRFKYLNELEKMGAKVRIEGRNAIFEGVEKLTGAPLYATDLRAGAAMVIAGLTAEGTTEVMEVYHIDRGYEAMEVKLQQLGADIVRVKE
ncbi:UDP-N-acetylglucosamine 1-carboxyvinyltransferase [Thermoanaerobacter brockii subsp. lactiethylicus]|jgi:UDP-N-acetylglucosamine 1-carboxyvinyltransferase|uniref:UDP-N-acetylglucosamine 1-carboxyvinyltransferase n=1 Tax=unclassified Thermoanaerobacter TaxID=2636821 RepID=UPI000164240B|nr:UDP-N-acetylglucosamine 1-carboxyvinyltransferase [Thermoanaerobacter sp. X514]ABY93603.1 UDP-N-acetylglucosamine 1-carboxyvinyltransferase [Thermoanaerobacter sp. X514]MBZ4656796.1 UDP-N-acetylglucosamine 1-carboxyvinyltransferase [Thermoanaerobacter sp.]MDI3500736.1 UDP-N-acetylglucosamine 1-carboxyvinyltransferase [Thermoanaerobacter sp.]HCD09515.1 UDP-N-acetylglucosamine 1-carboxyvinyltransferase [Thermoanaerobacter sp.]